MHRSVNRSQRHLHVLAKYRNDPKFSDRSGQTVLTQIRLLPEDRLIRIYSLPFRFHLLDALLQGKSTLVNNFSGVHIFRTFTVSSD